MTPRLCLHFHQVISSLSLSLSSLSHLSLSLSLSLSQIFISNLFLFIAVGILQLIRAIVFLVLNENCKIWTFCFGVETLRYGSDSEVSLVGTKKYFK